MEFINPMPKIKTKKSFSSRVKKTKTGKFIRRSSGQGHFNARDTGNDSRKKKSDFSIAKSEHVALNQAIPNS